MEVFMKKIMFLMVILAFLPVLVFAHGGEQGHGYNNNYSLCNFNDCYAQNVHYHNGTYYAPHFFGDGHSYHQQCNISACNYSTVHSHNGHHYFPNYHR
jgi:hypothetical protein